MKWRIRHKTHGWTGTIEVLDEYETSSSSHTLGFRVTFFIVQDTYKPDGAYVEDPSIESLDELEFIEKIV